MHETIERYRRHTKDVRTNSQSKENNMQHLKHETVSMVKKMELLERSKRKLLGEGLASCTIEELHELEQQLERSVSSIRARKMEVTKEQIEKLKEKEKVLTAENAMLLKFGLQPRQGSRKEKAIVPRAECSEISDVETGLFIGPPKQRNRQALQM